MITKNIPYGTLDIDIEKGRIWLNCPSCLLRIQNIIFKNPQEKFSMIDINGTDAHMYPGESSNETFNSFLETIILLIGLKISDMNENDKKSFLDKLTEKIKKEIKNDNIIG